MMKSQPIVPHFSHCDQTIKEPVNGILAVTNCRYFIMAGRTRPIEKFASAVGKCSKEVSDGLATDHLDTIRTDYGE